MTTQFKREERYYVFKISDVRKYLSAEKQEAVRQIAKKLNAGRAVDGKTVLQAVVVEHDWPEYEPVWQMIERRMVGGQHEPTNIHQKQNERVDGATLATLAGLETSISILSELVDVQRAILVDVERVCGVDDRGAPFEDGESVLIDRVRAHLAMTTAPQPIRPEQGEPVEFLANGMRFKISYDSRQSGGQIHSIPPELGGRWVALVAAEDNCHLKLATPQQRKPLTDEQKIVLGFLDGANPLQGVWYGDDHPVFGKAKHWWRRFLRQAFANDFSAQGIKGGGAA